MLKIENAEGTVLAYLNNLTNAKVHEVLNGEYTLSFVATIDHLKTDYLYDEENLINNDNDNDLFRVITLEELHDEDDALTVAVKCEHISYDLINNVMSDFNHTYSSAASVIAQCLQGTDFSLRSCDITEKTDIQYTEECNSKQISIAISNNWHGELKYYRRYIDLLQSRGSNRGTGFTFGKNLKSVKRIINRADKTTSYEVEVVQGSELEELGHYELGDTVRIMDERLNVDYECKIIEIEKDILTGINSKVVLGDAIKDMRSTFSSVNQDVEEVKGIIKEGATDWNKINDILNSNGEIVIGKLNALTQIASKIVNNTGTFKQLDNGAYWQDQPTKEGSTFATFWGAEGLLFANSKLANGEWDWQTAVSANGVIATELTSSCLNTVTANILNLVVDNLVGKTITGVTINGSKFISSNSSGDSMILNSGRIDFRSINGGTGILSTEELGLWNNGYTVILEPYNDFSLGEGSILSSSGTMIIGTRSVSSRISFPSSGGVYISTGLGSNQTVVVENDFEVWGQTNYSDVSAKSITTYGDLAVTGDKNSIVPTQHYGVRSLYADESDRAYFSTKGFAETINGECTIDLDPIFMETIELNSTSPYLIYITPYSKAHIWVEAVYDDRFIIRADKDTKFVYDLKAIRISYTNIYLEEKCGYDKKKLQKIQEAAVRRMSKMEG